MSISEFRAWLEGFSEAMGDAPTAEQWVKIKDKIDALQLVPTPVSVPSAPNRLPYGVLGGQAVTGVCKPISADATTPINGGYGLPLTAWRDIDGKIYSEGPPGGVSGA